MTLWMLLRIFSSKPSAPLWDNRQPKLHGPWSLFIADTDLCNSNSNSEERMITDHKFCYRIKTRVLLLFFTYVYIRAIYKIMFVNLHLYTFYVPPHFLKIGSLLERVSSMIIRVTCTLRLDHNWSKLNLPNRPPISNSVHNDWAAWKLKKTDLQTCDVLIVGLF